MLDITHIQQVYLHREYVDFRKSINGLSVIVEQQMALSPFSPSLFVFCNKKRDKLKVLYWDKTGFALWYKRLEQDKFKWPVKLSTNVIELTEQHWQWLLSGYDYLNIKGHQPLGHHALV